MPAQPVGRARPVLTGRALVLGTVVVLLVVVLASPVHRYLASRSDVTGTAEQLRRDRAALTSLTAQKQRYADPGYIQQQARSRLEYAMPGDTVYVVDRGKRADTTATAPSRVAGNDAAWNTRLFDSLRAAAR